MTGRARAAALAAAVLLAGCQRATELLVPAPAADGGAAGPWNCGLRCFADGVAGVPSFDGRVDPGHQPALVYPLPEAVLPSNLTGIALQWTRASDVTQTVFRVHLASATRSYDLYVPCDPPTGTMTPPASSQCAYTAPDRVWTAIAVENAGQTVAVTVSASDGKGGPVATAPTVAVAFSPAIRGGVYFWSYRDGGLYRAPFGARTAAELVAPGTGANGRRCAGCHGISRDGKVIAFSAGDAVDQPGSLTDALVTAPAAPLIAPASPPVPDASTMSLNADGTLLAVSYGTSGADSGHLVVRDATTGAVVARLDPAVLRTPETRVLFPEWSPDGKKLVATLSTQGLEAHTVTDGIIAVIPYDGGHFGPATVVVPKDAGGLAHYYPSWSPDGQLILFVSASPPSRLMDDVSYDNPSARLRLARSDGSAVYELARVNTGPAGGHTAGWPRFVWSAGPPWFFTFHSKRDYGFVLPNDQVAGPKGGLSQLWLASIDPARLPADPSSAPVWLPMQDVQQINNMAFPAPILCAPAVFPPSGCGPQESCIAGECLPLSQ
jgi:hypothetical protein